MAKATGRVGDLEDWEEGSDVLYTADDAERINSVRAKRPTVAELLSDSHKGGTKNLRNVQKVLKEANTQPSRSKKKGKSEPQGDDGIRGWLRAVDESDAYYDPIDQLLQDARRKSISGDEMEIDGVPQTKGKKKGGKWKAKGHEGHENGREGVGDKKEGDELKEEGEEERRERGDKEFREYFMKQVTESFADDLEELKAKEEMDASKIGLLIDCLESGIDVLTGFEKEFKVTHFKGKNRQPWHTQWTSGKAIETNE